MVKKVVSMIAWGCFSLMFLLTGCGGGGGGGDDGETPPTPQAPTSLYTYRLQGLPPGAEEPPGLVVDWEVIDGVNGTFRIHPNPGNSSGFTGTIDPDTRDVTIGQGAGCDVYDMAASGQFGVDSFRISTGNTIVLPAEGPPTAGVISINELSGDPFSIKITFFVSEPNVRVEYSGGDEETYATFDAFETLRTSVDPRQRLACFALDVFRFLLTQVDLVAYGLDWIGEFEAELESGPYSDTGDSFSKRNLTPPAGIANQGSFTASWNDVSNNDSIGPGDSFEFFMDQVWMDDDTSDEDFILDGTAALIGYTDVVNDDDETVRIGFEPFGAESGGVFLTDWTEHFTTTENNAVSIRTTFIINGAFSIVFEMD